jgi:hypothetical protein
VAGHIFQARPVWIYTQSNITNIMFTWVHNTSTEKKKIIVKSWITFYKIFFLQKIFLIGNGFWQSWWTGMQNSYPYSNKFLYSSYLYYKWFSKDIVDSGSIINRRMFYLLTQLSFENFDIEPNELNIPKYFDTT